MIVNSLSIIVSPRKCNTYIGSGSGTLDPSTTRVHMAGSNLAKPKVKQVYFSENNISKE